MIVVTILGVLALLGIPAAVRARARSQDTSFCNDMRLLVNETFTMYAMEHGDYPWDAPAGVVPKGVSPKGGMSYLPNRLDWTEQTPIGGSWDWDRAPKRGQQVHGICYAGLSVFAPERASTDLRKLDEILDDGNLLTGVFRKTDSGCIYILEE